MTDRLTALRSHAFPPCEVCGAMVDDPEAVETCAGPAAPPSAPDPEPCHRWEPVKGDCLRHHGPHKGFRCNGAVGRLIEVYHRAAPDPEGLPEAYHDYRTQYPGGSIFCGTEHGPFEFDSAACSCRMDMEGTLAMMNR